MTKPSRKFIMCALIHKAVTAMLLARVFTCIVIFVCIGNVCAKKFDTRCKLVRELIKCGMPSDIFLGQWVCLIEKVSKRDTSALTITASQKKSYGLFQIPGQWCREGKRGGECNIMCESLLDDDIRDDIVCAVQILHKKGFQYWTQWNIRCKNDMLITHEIYKCPDLYFPRNSPERYTSMDKLRHKRNIIKFSKMDFYELFKPHNMNSCSDDEISLPNENTILEDLSIEMDFPKTVRSNVFGIYEAYSRLNAVFVTSTVLLICVFIN